MIRADGGITVDTAGQVLAIDTLGRKTAVFRTEGADQIRAALMDGAGCVPASAEGRGTLMRFPYLDGHALIRKYRRGGAIRFLLKDRYLLHNRPLREFRLHLYVYDKGLSVPKPLGACWERRGICFAGAIATLEINAVNLLQYLRMAGSGSCSTGCPARSRGSAPLPSEEQTQTPAGLVELTRAPLPSEEETLRECGALIRQMHEIGVFHSDLQVRNILVGADGPLLIDFDKARLHHSLGPWRRARNLLRFRRSFRKCGLSEVLFQQLCEGYGTLDVPPLLDRFYHVKGRLSDALSGRD